MLIQMRKVTQIKLVVVVVVVVVVVDVTSLMALG